MCTVWVDVCEWTCVHSVGGRVCTVGGGVCTVWADVCAQWVDVCAQCGRTCVHSGWTCVHSVGGRVCTVWVDVCAQCGWTCVHSVGGTCKAKIMYIHCTRAYRECTAYKDSNSLQITYSEDFSM